LKKSLPTETENNDRRFGQKMLKTLSTFSLSEMHYRRGFVICKLRLRPADAGQLIGTSGRLRQFQQQAFWAIFA
jgi:hypothetical protein